MLLTELLTVGYVVTHIGNKGDIHGSLEYCNFKTSKHPWNIWKCKISIFYILKERPTVLQNLILLQIYPFVQWIND